MLLNRAGRSAARIQVSCVIDQWRAGGKPGDFNARRDARRGIVLRLVSKLRASRTRESSWLADLQVDRSFREILLCYRIRIRYLPSNLPFPPPLSKNSPKLEEEE